MGSRRIDHADRKDIERGIGRLHKRQTSNGIMDNYHCKRKGVLKYLEFVLHQMHFAQKDEEYFQLMNEELEREVGVNVLGTLKGEQNENS